MSRIDALLSAPAEIVEGETFNLASGTHHSIYSIACDVADMMNCKRDRIQLIGERPGQVVRHTGDWSKIKKTLNWVPQVAWQEGLKKTIQWYVENKAVWSKQTFMRRIPIITASGKMEYH